MFLTCKAATCIRYGLLTLFKKLAMGYIKSCKSKQEVNGPHCSSEQQEP